MRKKYPVPMLTTMMLLLLVSICSLPLSARAEIKGGSVEFSPFVGYNFFENRQNLENRPVYGGRLGYNFIKYLGIEATGEFIESRVDNRSVRSAREGQFTSPTDGVRIIMYNLDLVYHPLPDGAFNPYLVAGYGAAHYSPRINNKNMSVIDFGVGLKYWMINNIALRLDVRDKLVLDETIHNVETSLGVVFAFGGRGGDAVPPVVASQSVDSDGDHVPDSLDRCPGTPAGVAVDKYGCPLDFDKDGVPDYLDKCPDTPVGVFVGKDGCPLVVATVTILASEPKVEERIKEKVREAVVEPKIIILAFEDIHFDFDRATLTPEAQMILKRNIQMLKDNPKAKVRVAGYTSASGTEDYNLKLSERRARAVQEYLINEGVITPDRLAYIGYGEKHPATYEPAPGELYSAAAKSNMRVLFEIIVQ